MTRMVAICDRLDKFAAVKAIAHANDGHHVQRRRASALREATSGRCRRLRWSIEARDAKVVGIGETGLDQHYGYSDIVLQERSFVEHIHAARETGLHAGGAHARGRRSHRRYPRARVRTRLRSAS